MLNVTRAARQPKKGRSALSGGTRSPPSGFQLRRLCHDCSNPWRSDGADGADGAPISKFAVRIDLERGRFRHQLFPELGDGGLRWSLELPVRTSEAFHIDEVDVECNRERFITDDDSLCADALEARRLRQRQR